MGNTGEKPQWGSCRHSNKHFFFYNIPNIFFPTISHIFNGSGLNIVDAVFRYKLGIDFHLIRQATYRLGLIPYPRSSRPFPFLEVQKNIQFIFGKIFWVITHSHSVHLARSAWSKIGVIAPPMWPKIRVIGDTPPTGDITSRHSSCSSRCLLVTIKCNERSKVRVVAIISLY